LAQSPIRWGPVVVAALLSEVAVIAVLGIIIATHRFLIAPGRSEVEYKAFVSRASTMLRQPPQVSLYSFCALWATHRLTGVSLPMECWWASPPWS
jgi:hypothetical protein